MLFELGAVVGSATSKGGPTTVRVGRASATKVLAFESGVAFPIVEAPCHEYEPEEGWGMYGFAETVLGGASTGAMYSVGDGGAGVGTTDGGRTTTGSRGGTRTHTLLWAPELDWAGELDYRLKGLHNLCGLLRRLWVLKLRLWESTSVDG